MTPPPPSPVRVYLITTEMNAIVVLLVLLRTGQAAKATIMKRVDGYMKRAETLKDIVNEQAQAKSGMGTGGGGG